MQSAKWHFTSTGPLGNLNGDLYAFGADDDDMAEQIRIQNAALRASQPTQTFSIDNALPVPCYFSLAKQEFSNLLNLDAEQFWFNTPFALSVAGTAPALLDQTSIDKSPRSTFPTREGTDGQRLRAGKTKTEGAALNYLGKLFFLTSRVEFKDLWTALHDGKISSDEALAAAAILVQSG